MAEKLPPQDGLESYLAQAFEGNEGDTPSDGLWDRIEAELPPPVVPLLPWYARAGVWKWAASAAAVLIFGFSVAQWALMRQEVQNLQRDMALRDAQIESLNRRQGTRPGSQASGATPVQTPSESLFPPPVQPAPVRKAGLAPDQSPNQTTTTPGQFVVVQPENPVAEETAPNREADFSSTHSFTLAAIPPQSFLSEVSPFSSGLKLPVELSSQRGGMALRLVYGTYAQRDRRPEPHGPQRPGDAFAPDSLLAQTGFTTGLGLVLNDRRAIAFETGLYLTSSQRQFAHTPRFRYCPGGGGAGEQTFTYSLYTSSNKTDVSVTVAPTASVPDSAQVDLRLVTNHTVQSVQVPLLVRGHADFGRLRVFARGGLLFQAEVREQVDLVSAGAVQADFRISPERKPEFRPSRHARVQMGYLAGFGAEWRITPQWGVAAEPYVQGLASAGKKEKNPFEQTPDLSGGAALSVNFHF